MGHANEHNLSIPIQDSDEATSSVLFYLFPSKSTVLTASWIIFSFPCNAEQKIKKKPSSKLTLIGQSNAPTFGSYGQVVALETPPQMKYSSHFRISS